MLVFIQDNPDERNDIRFASLNVNLSIFFKLGSHWSLIIAKIDIEEFTAFNALFKKTPPIKTNIC